MRRNPEKTLVITSAIASHPTIVSDVRLSRQPSSSQDQVRRDGVLSVRMPPLCKAVNSKYLASFCVANSESSCEARECGFAYCFREFSVFGFPYITAIGQFVVFCSLYIFAVNC